MESTRAVKAPADAVKALYLQFAKLEEDYGLAERAMKVYDEATKVVPPNNEKLSACLVNPFKTPFHHFKPP